MHSYLRCPLSAWGAMFSEAQAAEDILLHQDALSDRAGPSVHLT
jgi:hypothetical protein